MKASPGCKVKTGQGFGQRFTFILTIFSVDIHYCWRLLEIVQRRGLECIRPLWNLDKVKF